MKMPKNIRTRLDLKPGEAPHETTKWLIVVETCKLN